MSSVEGSLKVQKTQHKNKLKNLIRENQIEIDKIKNEHQNQKSNIQLENKIELTNIMDEQQKKKAQISEKKEATLKNLQDSIERSRLHATKEQERIRQQMDLKKKKQNVALTNQLNKTKQTYQYNLQDFEHQAQVELERLDNQIRLKKAELKATSQHELKAQKSEAISKKKMNASLYEGQRAREENKYQKSLRKLKTDHGRTLESEIEKNQKALTLRKKHTQKVINNINKTGNARVSELQKNHERTYQDNLKRIQSEIQDLSNRKEEILNNFKHTFRKTASLQVKKDRDPFYHYHEIKPSIQKIENGQGYKMEIIMPEHESKKLRVTAEGKEITINFDRAVKEHKNYQGGSSTYMKKVETLTSKIKVDESIDSKSIAKNYQEGKLVVNFKLA